MLIGLVRHGETDWNAIGRIQGQTDIPLNEVGLEQARRVANRLLADNVKWDYVITSDLLRAKQTGEVIAQTLDVPMLPDDERLRERYFGQIEGTTKAERIEKWGEDLIFTDVGAETFDALQERAVALFDELYSKFPQGNILCVTHGGLIARVLIHLFENIEDKRIGNVSLSTFEYSPNTYTLKLHNCMKHNEC